MCIYVLFTNFVRQSVKIFPCCRSPPFAVTQGMEGERERFDKCITQSKMLTVNSEGWFSLEMVTLCAPLLGATCGNEKEGRSGKREKEKLTMFSLAFICARRSPPILVCREAIVGAGGSRGRRVVNKLQASLWFWHHCVSLTLGRVSSVSLVSRPLFWSPVLLS